MKGLATHSDALQSIKTLVLKRLYPQALRASASLLHPPLTDQSYALFLKSGFALDAFLSSFIVNRFAISGDFARARRFLLDTPYPDTVSWNSLISGYARFRQPGPVFDLFNGLRRSGLSPDEFSLSSLVKGCGVLEQNEVAHGVCLKMGLLNGFVVSGLLDGYAKLGDVDSAEKCFKEFYIADSVVWTAMVCGLFGTENSRRGVREGEQVFGLSVKMGLLCGCSIHLNNALMNMYSRCGSKSDAIKMFDEMTEPDVVSWTERIGAAYDAIEAFELFRLVLSGNMEVNEYMLINVLSAMREPKLLKSGRQIQGLCQKAGYLLVASVNNALIFMYGKCGEMVAARHIFDEMLCGDSVSWNSLIAGYAENGLMKQALKVFSQMRDYLLQPNKYTLASILEVAANSNFPEQAMQIHSYIVKLGFIVDDSMLSCLITAYATLVHAGCHADALKLFQTGWRLHQEVDCITLRLVNEARTYLSSMLELMECPMFRTLCLHDRLIGRVGLLEDARGPLIKCLLCLMLKYGRFFSQAANIHGNVDLGEVAAKKLIELQPENDSAYVLLSNLYASAGRWNAVGKLRRATMNGGCPLHVSGIPSKAGTQAIRAFTCHFSTVVAYVFVSLKYDIWQERWRGEDAMESTETKDLKAFSAILNFICPLFGRAFCPEIAASSHLRNVTDLVIHDGKIDSLVKCNWVGHQGAGDINICLYSHPCFHGDFLSTAKCLSDCLQDGTLLYNMIEGSPSNAVILIDAKVWYTGPASLITKDWSRVPSFSLF
ncbi:Pentatricopeptide repeat-containing protein, mitochondrial [Vitis vinifera]|uniref:Pentatricopeptide repeat-containing protein, mitochondrial n=1 Tax=Vitis vinifera TaxID=29760 RepID=A0A438J5E6_VITVI|nr:Pentatricopeptide repeat-containing protein, mitochondrial [Vitis vinifera]